MRYQKDSYSCGAAAVVNAVRCFGKKMPERIIQSWAETTEDGTEDYGILQALEALGLKGESFDLDDGDMALQRLTGAVTIICIQNSQHWVTVIGMTDDNERFVVVDPAKTKRNMNENGVQVLSRKQLLKTWQTRNKKYFGITVVRPKRKK